MRNLYFYLFVMAIILILANKPVYHIDDSKGKDLYNSYCAVCHMLEKKLVGPSFKDVIKGSSKKWFIDYTLHSKEMMSNKNEKALKIFYEYGNLEHPVFKTINKNDVKKIYSYLQKELKQE